MDLIGKSVRRKGIQGAHISDVGSSANQANTATTHSQMRCFTQRQSRSPEYEAVSSRFRPTERKSWGRTAKALR